MKNHDFGSLVCVYAQLLPRIREAGKRLGYAIAIHGSMMRDLDIVAVPWVDEAAGPEELVEAVREEVGGFVVGDKNSDGMRGPVTKPHGRLAWSICWGGVPFIDLSVMPRKAGVKLHQEQKWENEDRACFDMETLRKEFRERLYAKGE